MGSRFEAVKQYKKSETMEEIYKGSQESKNIIFSIDNNSGLHRELKKIKNIKAKSSKKRCDFSSNSSSD